MFFYSLTFSVNLCSHVENKLLLSSFFLYLLFGSAIERDMKNVRICIVRRWLP